MLQNSIMPETAISGQPELPNILTILAKYFKDSVFLRRLSEWQCAVFSLLIVGILSLAAFFFTRKLDPIIPGRRQNIIEAFVAGFDDFVCGILCRKGRRYTHFFGTLFIYILFMNLSGLIPFLKSATASWSTTMALAICVFVYLQYTAVRELGLRRYVDHMAGKPRGLLAFTVILPFFIFSIHILTELIRPLSLSLRLRSNVWGDDLLLAVVAGFGMKALPLFILNMAMSVLAAVVQAVVFCLLSMIYFAFVLTDETE